MADDLDPIRLRRRLDEVEAALERRTAERDQALAALVTVRKALVGGLSSMGEFDALLHETIDNTLHLLAGDHPSQHRPS